MTKLAEYIHETGRRKADLAKAIGVSRGYVTELCQGTKRPGLSVAVRIETATCGMVPVRSWESVPDDVAGDAS